MQAQEDVVQLWEDNVPGAIASDTYKEELQIEDGIVLKVYKVTSTTLTVFKPEIPNGTSVIICPGGGYQYLSIEKEGVKIAKWLNTLGITAFVLKYRLPSDEIMKDKSTGPLQDAQQAVRYVRRNASSWNLKEDKIGIIGFSAGGHLAAMLSTHYNDKVCEIKDTTSARPDFSVLVYPVISMDDSIAHKGSKKRLLGESPSEVLVEKFSADKQVDSLTPPTFLAHASDDKSVPDQNSINYYLALKRYDVPVEMHLYQKGGHGFGLGKIGTSQYWTEHCEEWLKANFLLE